MPATIHIGNGTTTINREDAIGSERNIVAHHAQFQSLLRICMQLWEHRSAVRELVAMHIGVSPERLEVLHYADWMRGGFNLVVPVVVKDEDKDKDGESTGAAADKASVVPDADEKKVLLRVPMPAKVGEEQHPGSVANKLRCKTASYIWMQRHCSDVRIPHLYGMGFPGADGVLHFSHASQLSVVRRAVLYVRQLVAAWLHRPVPSAYLPVVPTAPAPSPLAETGYLVLENLSEARFGKQIPYVVPHDRPLHTLYAEEPVKTRNLCRGLARTMLALARVPQPRIGAFRFCLADGTIHLDGRPVPCDTALLESEGAPQTIGLDTTYAREDRYAAALARAHEEALLAQPHAAMSDTDAEYQMGVMAVLRAVAPCFVESGDGDGDGDGDSGNRPYILHLSDSNPGNVLVDDDWQVTAAFDLEWLFAAPVAQLRTPLWLTWESIDDVAKGSYASYCAARAVFMDVFRDEEAKQSGTGATPLSDAMDASWASQRTWFYSALTSVSGMTHVFEGRLRPLFWPKTKSDAPRADDDDDAGGGADAQTPAPAPADELPYDAIVAQKARDRAQHEAAVERLFCDKKTRPEGRSDKGNERSEPT